MRMFELQSERLLQPVVCMIVFCFACLPVSAQVTTLFEDAFDQGDPNPGDPSSPWQAHGDGLPASAAIGGSVFSSFLTLFSVPEADKVRGVETIDPISINGLTNVTIDARVTPINGGVNGTWSSIELAVQGSSGEWLQVAATNNPASQGADFNSSGGVDSIDLPFWEAGYGIQSGATVADGNANPYRDDKVNGADLLLWQQQLGYGLQGDEDPENGDPANVDDWADIYDDSTGNHPAIRFTLITAKTRR